MYKDEKLEYGYIPLSYQLQKCLYCVRIN